MHYVKTIVRLGHPTDHTEHIVQEAKSITQRRRACALLPRSLTISTSVFYMDLDPASVIGQALVPVPYRELNIL